MNLRIRKLRFLVTTEKGTAGRDLEFPNGCTVIQSINTVGKSSILNGILYALGMEGMIGPSHDVPLPHALTDWIEIDGTNHPVIESRVLLELEGEGGTPLTVARAIKAAESNNLIKTWAGLVLTDPDSNAPRKDYYVRQPGAAKRTRGFHAYLERFIGWTLPDVPRYQADPEKLYLEAVWPLLYVEQKQGWSVIEGKFPTYLGIKQMPSRAIEFLLKLDAYDLSTQRVSIVAAESRLRSEWESLRRDIDRTARQVNGVIEGIAPEPSGEWPPTVPPRFLLPRANEWLPAREELATLVGELEALERAEIPRAGAVIKDTERQLSLAEQEYLQTARAHEMRLADLDAERSQLASLHEKIASTEGDLQRHQDLQKLRDLGSDEVLRLSDGTCPTCSQPINDSLLLPATAEEIMGLDQNITFLNDQLKTFRFMVAGTQQAITAKERAVAAGLEHLDQLRASIRTLKRTLVSDGRLPSQAALQRRIALETRIDQIQRVAADVERELNAFAHLSDLWRDLQLQRRKLPPGELSAADRSKLADFRRIFVEHVREYGLRSVDPTKLEISLDNYRPTYEGIDLQFDLSASDTIRTIWAYRLGLLELSRLVETNHPGLLIVDEPGQQEASSESVTAFLRRCARGTVNQQVIVATSETLLVVGAALHGTGANLLTFDDFIFQWL